MAGVPSIDVTIGLTATTIPTLHETVSFLVRHRLRSFHLAGPIPRARLLDRPELVAPYPVAIPAITSLMLAYPQLDIAVQGIPFCLLPESVRHRARPLPFFLFPEIRPLKAKHGLCSGCTEYILCMGFWREKYEGLYQQAELMGAELEHGSPEE
jgi:hypothetical protein